MNFPSWSSCGWLFPYWCSVYILRTIAIVSLKKLFRCKNKYCKRLCKSMWTFYIDFGNIFSALQFGVRSFFVDFSIRKRYNDYGNPVSYTDRITLTKRLVCIISRADIMMLTLEDLLTKTPLRKYRLLHPMLWLQICIRIAQTHPRICVMKADFME